MTGIVAGIQYLKRVGGIPEDQDENITFILNEVNRIDRLINDILGVVRTGELVYHPVHVESIIKSAVTSLKDGADRRSVTLTTKFPAHTRPVMIDSDKITQVIINLLKNAIEASAFLRGQGFHLPPQTGGEGLSAVGHSDALSQCRHRPSLSGAERIP